LLELLKESLALHGRDMPLLEDILARKQALIILLEQHGRKRSQILTSLNLPADRDGLEQLASQSSWRPTAGPKRCADQLLAQCQEANLLNGQSIQISKPLRPTS
jgi:flagella synthesis protein FlgN